MKLTWFGGTTMRIYIGGEIVVIDADTAPPGIDRAELLAGADHIVQLRTGSSEPMIDPAKWRPKPAARGIDAPAPLEILRISRSTALISAAGESPVVVFEAGEAPRFGRWADGAVIVLMHSLESMIAEATVLLDVARPRLIALAADEQTLDLAIDELAEHLDGAGLVSLEPGLALEV
jgi:hypothetical protein